MSHISQHFQSKRNTFLFDILWSVGHHLTGEKNNKAVNGVINQKFLEEKISLLKSVEVHPLLYIYIYIYIYIIYIYIYIYNIYNIYICDSHSTLGGLAQVH